MFRKLKENEDLPWELLLLADPEKKMIETYIYGAHVFIYEEGMLPVGVIVIEKQNDPYYEIMNVAVAEHLQGQGLGKLLVNEALNNIISNKIENKPLKVRVKTGETSKSALYLYKSCGFHVIEIVKDYFLINYEEPIYEEGELLRNQIILEKLV